MSQLRRTALGRAESGEALRLLAEWCPADRSNRSLHPGDVGWALRFEEDEVRSALAIWSDSAGPVAVELLDAPVCRLSLAPRLASDPAAADALAVAIAQAGPEWIDLPADSRVWTGLTERGWTEDPDPWVHLVLPFTGPVQVDRLYTVLTAGSSPEDAADRVAVQRAAFKGSSYSVERWKLMHSSPAAAYCVDIVVHTVLGDPAAGATGWFAGAGKCGVLEPVGADPTFRRQGFASAASLAAAEELRKLGASAVAVVTPADNEAAVALYRSCGFEIVGMERSLHRAS